MLSNIRVMLFPNSLQVSPPCQLYQSKRYQMETHIIIQEFNFCFFVNPTFE